MFLVPTREELGALARGVIVAVLAAAAGAPFRGVTALAGTHAARERQGAITLALLVIITVQPGLRRRLPLAGSAR